MPPVPNSEIVKRDLCAKWLRAIGTSLVLILAVSIALRLSFMREEQRRIPAQWLSVAPFQYETGNIAFALATGKGFSSPLRVDTGPTAWLTPIYPAIVAGFFKAFGPYTFGAFEATALLNILFSALTCIPIYFAGARIGGTGLGALAGWLWAIFPAAVMIPFDWVWDTSLSALLAATILWATLWVADSLRWRDWFVYGILWGFTLMTNPSLGSLLPFLLGWIAWRAAKKKYPAWLRQSALTIAIIFLACLPWTIRNYRVFHALVPLRTTLGLQLWLGNNPYYIHAWGAWLHPIDNAEERAKFIAMGEVPYMREKFRLGLEYMCRFPGRVAEISWQKFVTTWLGTTHPVRDFEIAPQFRVRAVEVSNDIVSLGVLAGILTLFWRRNPFAFPLAAVPIIYPLLYYVTVPMLRYRHPIDPVIILLTAAGIVGIFPRKIWPMETQVPNATSAAS
ncbi:MAG TPA: glycosyltransferase family 39 protein [Candidatus Acidoferrales bacterium]|nr:glycosyltransferase family 39 protein [Candidatus Acidoferrales bacterium]